MAPHEGSFVASCVILSTQAHFSPQACSRFSFSLCLSSFSLAVPLSLYFPPFPTLCLRCCRLFRGSEQRRERNEKKARAERRRQTDRERRRDREERVQETERKVTDTQRETHAVIADERHLITAGGNHRLGWVDARGSPLSRSSWVFLLRS